MKISQKITSIIMLMCLVISLHAKETIVLGLTGTVFKDDLKNFMDWEKYLEQNNDFDVQIVFSKTYEEMNALIKDEKVDVAYVCNSSFTQLQKSNTAKLLTIPIVNQTDQYYSYIIAKSESKYNNLLDFKDAIFAFTDPGSNSGTIAPSYYMYTKNINAKKFFKSYIYTYEHGESINAVLDGFVDGASVDSIVYSRYKQKYPERIKKLKIIQTLGPYTNSPIVARINMDDEVFNTLQKLFTQMHLNPYGKSILDGLSLDRFDVPSDQDFSNVAKMIEILR